MTSFGFGFEHRAAPPSSQELAAAWKPYIETCIDLFGPERCMSRRRSEVVRIVRPVGVALLQERVAALDGLVGHGRPSR